MFAVVTEVGVDLSGVGVGEGLGLEVDEDVAFQPAVVEDQIDEVVGAADADLFLTGLEAEAVTQFEKEGLEVVDERALQIFFPQGLGRRESEEFENVGIPDDVHGAQGLGGFMGKAGEFLLVRGKAGAFEEQGTDLAFQSPDSPCTADGFDLVEDSLQGVVEFHQFDEMGEAERLEKPLGWQGESRPGRSVGSDAVRDQVPKAGEADDWSLGRFSGQCLENRQELRCPGERFSGQCLENARVLGEKLATGPEAGSPQPR